MEVSDKIGVQPIDAGIDEADNDARIALCFVPCFLRMHIGEPPGIAHDARVTKVGIGWLGGIEMIDVIRFGVFDVRKSRKRVDRIGARHPFAEWKKEQFWGLAAFFSGIEGQTMNEFTFIKSENVDRRDIKIPNTETVIQASFLDGSEPQWKFKVGSRVTLADWVTSPKNPYFARAAANPGVEDVAPVGDAFLRAVIDGIAMRDPYVPEAGKIDLWHTDFFHPSKYGAYLSAAVHFMTITGINPLTLGSNEQAAADLRIAPDIAVKLQRVAQAVVAPDLIAPVTTIAVSEPPNATGWNRGNVTVTFSATDNAKGSGFDAIHYTLAGAQTGADTFGASGAITITAEGVTTLTYFSTDRAGNSEAPRTLRISIDKTQPAILGMPAAPCSLWPPNRAMLTVATVSAVDGVSPIASFSVSASSNEPPSIAGQSDTQIAGSGTAPRTIALRADRLGTGTGRIYTITANATDAAGNTTSATATCLVPHNQ